jgi:hypothetical protein
MAVKTIRVSTLGRGRERHCSGIRLRSAVRGACSLPRGGLHKVHPETKLLLLWRDPRAVIKSQEATKWFPRKQRNETEYLKFIAGRVCTLKLRTM